MQFGSNEEGSSLYVSGICMTRRVLGSQISQEDFALL